MKVSLYRLMIFKEAHESLFVDGNHLLDYLKQASLFVQCLEDAYITLTKRAKCTGRLILTVFALTLLLFKCLELLLVTFRRTYLRLDSGKSC